MLSVEILDPILGLSRLNPYRRRSVSLRLNVEIPPPVKLEMSVGFLLMEIGLHPELTDVV